MADADRETCPRCGAPIASDDPAGLCPRCLVSDTRAVHSQDRPVSTPSLEKARPTASLSLASTVAAIVPSLLRSLGFGKRQGQQPADAVAHYSRGTALYAQGKLDEAAAAFREAIRLKPDMIDALTGLGIVLAEQGRTEEAIAAHGEVIRLKPDFADAHYNLGLALEVQGTLDEAIAEFRTAIRLKPDLAEAHLSLGTALHGQGRLDQAIAEFPRQRSG